MGKNTFQDNVTVNGTLIATGNVTFDTNTLFVDAANNRVGIGTASPSGPLHIESDITSSTNGFIITRTGVSSTDANLQLTNGTSQASQFVPTFVSTSNFSLSSATTGLNFIARITNANSGDIGVRFDSRTKAGAALTQGWIATFDSFADSKMRLSWDGNLVIQNGGAFTNAGFRLDVNGTARVQGDFTVVKSQNAATICEVQNQTSGTAARAYFQIKSDTNSGDVLIQKYSTLFTGYKFLTGKDAIFMNLVGGDISILNDVATGKIKIASGASSTPQWTIESTGQLTASDAINIAVGTTTGTKIGTGTTQKLGFFNATPIVQPVNTVAINDVLVNLGLRASGGVSNFTTNIDISTRDIVTDGTTGTKIGTATTQKLGFWNAAPIVQPTTAVAAATLVGGGGTNLTDTDTFDGYTLQQVVKALRDAGLLA